MNLRAGWVRLLFSGAGMIILPLLEARTAQHRWLLFCYFVGASISQWLIYTRRGGIARMVVMGALDLSVLTYLVHRLDSMSATMVPIYIFIGMMYALTLPRRVAEGLAVFGSLLYVGVMWAEMQALLPHAPDAPSWAPREIPHPTNALVISIALPLLFIGSTSLVARLMQEIRDREDELERLSQRDPLTQLFNRRYLLERLSHELARRQRGHPVAVVMIDLDRFKRVNDTHGHVCGDELLRDVAGALREATRKIDVVGRYGGDEFLVVLPDTDAEEASNVVRRLVDGVREVGRRFDDTPVTGSLGMCEAQPGDDVTLLLRRADDHAYQAKRDGGDRCAS